MTKRIISFLCSALIALQAHAQFIPGQVLGAAALNAALASPTILGGSINGAPIGATNPSSGKFTTLQTTNAFTSPGISDAATTTALSLSGSGANRVTIASGVTPTIGTSSGNLRLAPASNGVNVDASGTNSSTLYLTNSNGISRGYASASHAGVLNISSSGSGGISLQTNSGTAQVLVTNTASANRYITLTGSNNGDPAVGTNAGDLNATSHVVPTKGTPTIASGACGTGSNGSVSGYDQAGKITIGSAATTTCTVTYGAAFSAAPSACTLTPATAASASATVLPYTASISTGTFVVAGSALASTSFYYHCF